MAWHETYGRTEEILRSGEYRDTDILHPFKFVNTPEICMNSNGIALKSVAKAAYQIENWLQSVEVAK